MPRPPSPGETKPVKWANDVQQSGRRMRHPYTLNQIAKKVCHAGGARHNFYTMTFEFDPDFLEAQALWGNKKGTEIKKGQATFQKK